MSNVYEVVFQKLVEGALVDVMVRSDCDNVIMSDGRKLSAFMADYLTGAQTEQKINDRIDELLAGAPEAFDTLKEIADYILEHGDVVDALNAAIGGKVDKVAGKGLSAEDFTTELKAKLEGLSNYTHPLTHSADMITETADRRFVTSEEKAKIAKAGRFIMGDTVPGDLTENDLFAQVIAVK